MSKERVPHSYNPEASGNNFLFHLLGVKKVKVAPSKADVGKEMQKVADGVVAEGGKPYIVPGGVSYPLGATGYVACVCSRNSGANV